MLNLFRKKLTRAELAEMKGIQQLATQERFKAAQVKANTALVPNARAYVNQTEAIAQLMENSLKAVLAQRLAQYGYPEGTKVRIDLKTGVIHKIKNESRNNKNVVSQPTGEGTPAVSPVGSK